MSAKKNILIVEDHPLFRAMLVQLINNEPSMTVCSEVDNISDAFTSIRLTPPDAAIIDITLQRSCGLEFIKSLKAHNILFPMLVLSMHAETLYAERVIRAGAKGYISKSASPFEVINAVKQVLEGRVYVSELINREILERLAHKGNVVQPLIAELSDREIEVFQLIGGGLNSREIAERLHLGASTIDSYRARIKEKLGIKNAAELYQRATQWLLKNNLSP
jgi:DNA-binding NarL/FixJ family response regulator